MRIALIRGGVVRDVINAELQFAEGLGYDAVVASDAAGIGDTFDGNSFSRQRLAPQPEPRSTDITPLAFRKRFTVTEREDIELAAVDSAAASPAVRRKQARLRVLLGDIAVARSIDLAAADVRAYVSALESEGLIAPGRAAQILDGEVQPHERP